MAVNPEFTVIYSFNTISVILVTFWFGRLRLTQRPHLPIAKDFIFLFLLYLRLFYYRLPIGAFSFLETIVFKADFAMREVLIWRLDWDFATHQVSYFRKDSWFFLKLLSIIDFLAIPKDPSVSLVDTFYWNYWRGWWINSSFCQCDCCHAVVFVGVHRDILWIRKSARSSHQQARKRRITRDGNCFSQNRCRFDVALPGNTVQTKMAKVVANIYKNLVGLSSVSRRRKSWSRVMWPLSSNNKSNFFFQLFPFMNFYFLNHKTMNCRYT